MSKEYQTFLGECCKRKMSYCFRRARNFFNEKRVYILFQYYRITSETLQPRNRGDIDDFYIFYI